jgi:hypothetical protein
MMKVLSAMRTKMKNMLEQFLHSFPIQLLFFHIRRNLALLCIWVVLIAVFSGNLGSTYGIHYLFLDPEYLGTVNFWSFFILGVAFGQLSMAFHMSCYILDSHRFPFVGILERPFAKFVINNSLVPMLTYILYVIMVIRFQTHNEFKDPWNIFTDIMGLISGRVLLQIVTFYYFRLTNKDIFKFLAGSVDKRLRKAGLSRNQMMRKLRETKKRQTKREILNYLDLSLRVRSTDNLQDFYNKEAVLKVFDQNHFNSVLIGIGVIVTILMLGIFMDNPAFQIPAAASVLLMFTILVIMVGAITYWFRGWAVPFVIALFLVLNVAIKLKGLGNIHEAKGMDYDGALVEYSIPNLRAHNTTENFHEDVHAMLHRLEAWKANQESEKPMMVFLCVSGGGQRAALWAVTVLQQMNDLTQGKIMKQTSLITGASGGMVGAAYFRELYLRSMQGEGDLQSVKHLESISRDNLNPVIFSLLVNDAFLRFRKFIYEDKIYTLDRGVAFENSLIKNTEGVLDKKLSEYFEPEETGTIPTLILSPTIANDGRKLYIATRPVTFMNMDEFPQENFKIRGVDFQRFFESQGAANLHFMSALRMSASFPYITPTISMPSEPRMEIMDAGISDNFGVSDALRFLYVFREWISENTAGVTVITIRDTDSNAPIAKRSASSFIDRLTYPIGSVYNNLGNMQDRNNDARLEHGRTWAGGKLHYIELVYSEADSEMFTERASLSWHLTTKEKISIIENIHTARNKKALEKVKELIGEEE